MNHKHLLLQWTRNAARLQNVITQLESDLKWYQEQKKSQTIIDKKDAQINDLVDFYNDTEELITAMKATIANLKIENHFLTDMIAMKIKEGNITLDEFLKRIPRHKVAIANTDTLTETTISEK